MSFPRGGGLPLSALEYRQAVDKAKEDVDNEPLVEQKRKRRNRETSQAPKKIKDDVAPQKGVEILKYKQLAVGMQVLGIIKEVNELELVISLPNHLVGFATIMDINQKVSSMLPSDEDEDDLENCDLRELFKTGQFVRCVVTSLATSSSGKKRIQVSLDPNLYQSEIKMQEGMHLNVAVKSEEDHGFVCTINNNTVGFLPKQNQNLIAPGMIIECKVSRVEGRAIVLSQDFDPSNYSASCTEVFENLSVGHLVPCKVKEITSTNLICSIHGMFEGYVNLFHFGATIKNLEEDIKLNFKVKQKLFARILYLEKENMRVGLSIAPHIVNCSYNEKEYFIGDIREDLRVERVDPGLGLVVSFNQGISTAYAHISRLDDESETVVDKRFKVGSLYRGRIIDFDPCDGLSQVSFQPSILSQKFLRVIDLTGGMIISGKILTVSNSGLLVKVTDQIKAFCPASHFADAKITKPQRVFKEDSVEKFEILSVDVESKKVLLTRKKSLMKSTLPKVKSFEDLTQGLITVGVVCGLKAFGCFVSFYNNVKILVPLAELSYQYVQNPREVCSLGQTVTVRITRVDAENRKAFGSMKLIINHSKKFVTPGMMVDAKIVAVTDDDIYLKSDFETNFILPRAHTHDDYDLAKEIKFQVEQELRVLILRTSAKGHAICTMKHSLINAMEMNDLPLLSKDVKEGQILLGSILRILESGYLVSFLGNLVGFVAKHDISDEYVIDPNEFVHIHQTVCVHVLSVKGEKISLSMKESLLGKSYSTLFLNHYFCRLLPISCSSVVEGSIREENDHAFLVDIKDHPKITGVFLKTHGSFKAQMVVADVDPETNIADCVPITAIRKVAKEFAMTGKVLLVKKRYLICEVDGTIIYVAVHSFNKFINAQVHFSIGQLVNVTNLGKSVDGRKIGSIQQKSFPKISFTGESIELTRGKKVSFKVSQVKCLQVNGFLPDHSTARIHISQLRDLDVPLIKLDLKRGSIIESKIMGIHDTKNHVWLPFSHKNSKSSVVDLTCRASDMELADQTLSDYLTFDDLKVGEMYTGVIGQNDSHGSWFHLSCMIAGYLEYFVYDKKTVGQVVKAYLVHKEDSKCYFSLSMMDQIKSGDIVPGRVISCTDNCYNVYLGMGIKGRLSITEVSDDFVEEPMKLFDIDSIIKVNVLSVKEKIAEVTMKKNPIRNLEQGMIVQGYVKQIAENAGLFVSLSHSIVGRCKISQVSDGFVPDWKAHFKIGQLVSARILEIQGDHIELTLKKSVVCPETFITFDSLAKDQTVETMVKAIKPFGIFLAIKDSSVSGLCHVSQIPLPSPGMELSRIYSVGDIVEAKISKIDPKTKKVSLSLIQKKKDQQQQGESEYTKVTGKADSIFPLQSVPSEAFDWKVTDAEQDLVSDTENEAPKKTSKRKQKTEKALKEKQIREREMALARAGLPETQDDYDRWLTGNPNDSFVWISYMAFMLNLAEVPKAREIAEKALKTINFREEKEKLNVWFAFLNLENVYGTRDSLMSVFQRAISFNEPKPVYLQMASMLEASKKINDAKELWQVIVKKFKQSCKVWVACATFYMNIGDEEYSRSLFSRSLKSLEKRKHVKAIIGFALLEFKQGDCEKGRTIFEELLSHFPKRIDLWNIYLDMEVKTNTAEAVRRLFERVLSLKFSSKKMKFLFKKYISFERTHGSDENVEHVKQLALDYVEGQEE